MERVGAILQPVLIQLSLQERVTLELLRHRWHHLFGEPLSRHTSPSAIDRGTLVVAVDSPVWLQQLKFYRQEMAGKLGAYGVRDLRFKLGRVSSRAEASGRPQASHRPSGLSPAAAAWVEETLSPIDDAALRETVRGAIARSLEGPASR